MALDADDIDDGEMHSDDAEFDIKDADACDDASDEEETASTLEACDESSEVQTITDLSLPTKRTRRKL